MTIAFEKIGIMGKFKTTSLNETLTNLMQHLKDAGVAVYLDQDTAQAITAHAIKALHHDIQIVSSEDFKTTCDLVIVIGGDGSMLNAARSLVAAEVAVLGINQGKVGFLTDISPEQLEKLHQILAGKFVIEKRCLLQATVMHEQQAIAAKLSHNCALNEIALMPSFMPQLIEFSVYVNGSLVANHRSDGIIIATPTGSTAYALAAGGPIIHPAINAITIVPMFAQSLNIRPIVINDTAQIQIILNSSNIAARLACDGQVYFDIPPTSTITITKYAKQLNLVHPVDYDYFAALRSKLHWGKKFINPQAEH